MLLDKFLNNVISAFIKTVVAVAELNNLTVCQRRTFKGVALASTLKIQYTFSLSQVV